MFRLSSLAKIHFCRQLLLIIVFFSILNIKFTPLKANTINYDIVVYGGTSAGVIASVEATRLGKKVLLIEQGNHLGGLSSGGLGATDIGNKAAIGGLARTFYEEIYRYYNPNSDSQNTMWTFEPHLAEKIFNDLINKHNIEVIYNERLDLTDGVVKTNNRIKNIKMESGLTIKSKIFIDATYEGDLMALANVSYTYGRESVNKYGETLNGVQTKLATKHQLKNFIDPYIIKGNSSSGLLPGIQNDGGPGEEGSSDHRIQAYCFRMCLTDSTDNKIPFPKPLHYDPLRYELLLRYINTGVFDVLDLSTPMPNRKTDTNNKGGFATDNIGMNYKYPEGNYELRKEIIEEHENYQKGLMWFLANDPRVPSEIQEEVCKWGLPKDEFVDNGNWPHQLYIREARRMISDYVMTQHNCEGVISVPDPIGLAAYTMDSHHVQRYLDKNGRVKNEGDVQVGGFPPYPISYKSIVPKFNECNNLIVPVCLSSSHIAFGSIRMEPVFMVLAQSAAIAAVESINSGKAVQKIDYKKLKTQLIQAGQVLEWKEQKSDKIERIINIKNNLPKDKNVKSINWSDVSKIKTWDQYYEFSNSSKTWNFNFTTNYNSNYSFVFNKAVNNKYGTAEIFLNNNKIGLLNCFGAINTTIPAIQTINVERLNKGNHTISIKLEENSKIGIDKILLRKSPHKIDSFLISQSFPEFIKSADQSFNKINNPQIKWEIAPINKRGIIDLGKHHSRNENCHAYAITEIESKKNRKTNLYIGHNDGAIIWLNGELVYQFYQENSFAYNEFAVPIQLKKGKNLLKIIIMQAKGQWLFNANIETSEFTLSLPKF